MISAFGVDHGGVSKALKPAHLDAMENEAKRLTQKPVDLSFRENQRKDYIFNRLRMRGSRSETPGVVSGLSPYDSIQRRKKHFRVWNVYRKKNIDQATDTHFFERGKLP